MRLPRSATAAAASSLLVVSRLRSQGIVELWLNPAVLKACSTITGKLGWQIPYILQWVWPVPLALGCFFAPESAWWLARHERYEDAERTIVRCAKPGFYAEREAAGFVAFMRHTDALEKIEAANGSWKEMFMGVNLRRTEIVRDPSHGARRAARFARAGAQTDSIVR